MLAILNKIRRCEAGATAIEYGLIAALLSIGIIAGVRGVRSSLNTTFQTVQTQLTNANSAN